MKVNTGSDIQCIAAWLNFLRHARSFRMEDLAKPHGMSRSNLTTFINSGGEPGWVSPEKARNALFSLGMHSDGSLAPGLHRWQVVNAGMALAMVSILRDRDASWMLILRLRQGGGYLLTRIGRLAHVFAELTEPALSIFQDAGGACFPGIHTIHLDQDGDALAQTLWMNTDGPTVLDHFKALRTLTTATN